MYSVGLIGVKENQKGGGWSWASQFTREMNCVPPEQADVVIIPSASMVKRDQIPQGKKLILRADNFLKDSRNRGTGMTRMKDFARQADAVIFQSEWAKRTLTPHLEPLKASHVVLNGSDDKNFTPGVKDPRKRFKRFLYVRQNRDDSKNPHMAFSKFREIREENDELWIVGQFSSDAVQWNFDLGELPVKYLGSVPFEQMPTIYQQCDALLYSYFDDAASNAAIEAILSGLEIVDCYSMCSTGGMPDILASAKKGRYWLTTERMIKEYREVIESIL